jgi:hypothetical protein
MSLYTIDLSTGAILQQNAGMTTTGAKGLIEGEWNHISFMLNLEDSSFRLFVNGVLYGTGTKLNGMYNSGGWKTCTNISNIVVTSNCVIFSKVNKVTAAYKAASDVKDDYSDANYLDIDNVTLRSEAEALLDRAVEELDKHPSLYTAYSPKDNVRCRTRIVGGVVI